MAPLTLILPTAHDTQALGVVLGRLLRAGDLLVLSGGLGAGKTTLTQGIGEGMDVRGPITSPTFVIARTHPALSDGPSLIHADAYRLGSRGDDPRAELDDLDLDTALADAVTVVEWGEGLAQALSGELLQLTLVADPATEARSAELVATGTRWQAVLSEIAAGFGQPVHVDRERP